MALTEATLPDLLACLELSLAQDTQLIEMLEPGLQEEVIRSMTSPLGLSLPPAAVTWFSWHDGTRDRRFTDGNTTGQGRGVGASPMRFMSLTEAVHHYKCLVSVAERIAREMGCTPGLAGWDRSWFPLFDSQAGSVAGIDCSEGPSMGAIRVVHKADENPEGIDAESLVQVVGWWLRLLAEGDYRWDGTRWFDTYRPIGPFPEYLDHAIINSGLV